MRLRHLNLPGLTRYAYASAIQERLVKQFLSRKAAISAGTLVQHPPLEPVVITAQFHPVYTCGRRERFLVSPEQEAHLRAGGRADFFEALRGGQTTYHGPGQLTAYLICDLKAHGLSPRCYVDLLEGSVIDTIGQYGVEGKRTENPGVWVDSEHKICAVGVHLRRFISSHGIGLNVDRQPEEWLGRIVACGLTGKSSTSLEAMGVGGLTQNDDGVRKVSDTFVTMLSERLNGVEEVISIREEATQS